MCEAEYARTAFDRDSAPPVPWARILFAECTFDGVVLEETRLEGCIFRACVFRECRWSFVECRGVRFQSTVFRGGKLVGLALDGDAIGNGPLDSLRLEETVLLSCTFAGVGPPEIAFPRCRFTDCAFVSCQFPGTDFSGARFERSPFSHCDLGESDFREIAGPPPDPRTNHLAGARFSPAAAPELLAPFGIRFD